MSRTQVLLLSTNKVLRADRKIDPVGFTTDSTRKK